MPDPATKVLISAIYARAKVVDVTPKSNEFRSSVVCRSLTNVIMSQIILLCERIDEGDGQAANQ